jgi:hypothetical protein
VVTRCSAGCVSCKLHTMLMCVITTAFEAIDGCSACQRKSSTVLKMVGARSHHAKRCWRVTRIKQASQQGGIHFLKNRANGAEHPALKNGSRGRFSTGIPSWSLMWEPVDAAFLWRDAAGGMIHYCARMHPRAVTRPLGAASPKISRILSKIVQNAQQTSLVSDYYT